MNDYERMNNDVQMEYDVQKSLPSDESYAREIMSYGMSVKFDTVRIGEKYILIKCSRITKMPLCKVVITGIKITNSLVRQSDHKTKIAIAYMPVNDIDKNDKYNHTACEHIVDRMINSTYYDWTPYPTKQSNIYTEIGSWYDYIAIIKPYDINNPLTIRKMAPVLGLKGMVDAIIASRGPEEAIERRAPLLAARSK
jgi:hypothetical protein